MGSEFLQKRRTIPSVWKWFVKSEPIFNQGIKNNCLNCLFCRASHLVPCIYLDAYPNDHCPEGKMVITTDFEFLQVVIIQNAVIHPLTGRTFTINGSVLFTIPRNTGMKPEVGAVFYIDYPSIAAFPAPRRAGTLLNPVAGKGTTEFLRILILSYSQLHMRRPALHNGCASLSREISSGSPSAEPLLLLISTSAFMSQRSSSL